MKKTDLAYTAGIIDGEGFIGIVRRKNKQFRQGYQVQLDVSVNNSNEWLCQWLKFAYGGCFHCYTNSWGNAMYGWIVSAQKASAVLKLILPYLKLKQPQAELAIKFQTAKYKGGKPRSPEELAIEEAQRIILQSMHCRKQGEVAQ